ncbi:MAG TPA: glycosyltransferase [Nocardioides sp.]|nr:glycosyltransferase [Nocardioides sp.]
MADILFVTWDGGGAVPPALGIADELRARDHAVRFLGHAAQAEALRAKGYDVAPGRHARAFSGSDENSPLALMAALGDRGMGRDLLEAVAARPADLVVVDCFMFGALAAARDAGLRYVVLEHTFDDYYERSCLRGPLGLSLRLRRLAPRRALASARARLVTSVPELDPAGAAPHLSHIGPVVDVAPRTPGTSTVLVSLSTFGYSGMQQVLQNVIDATEGLEARVVVTTGPLVEPDSLTHPAHVEVHRFVPHVELMPSATVLVGHGGHGTTMQALAHDLPVLVLPMSRITDQPMIGRVVAAAGAGLVAPRTAPPEDLAPKIAALLGDGPHREAAARLGAAIRARPGATLGADRIEESLRDAAPARGRPEVRP